MKTLFPTCVALLFPLLILAQSDWCTCMKTQTSYEDISSYVSQADNRLLTLSSSLSTPIYEDRSVVKYKTTAELPKPVEEEENEKPFPEAKESKKSSTLVKTAPDIRKSYIQKRRKLFAKHLKKRKRMRKYRGKCPRLY